MSLSRTDDNGDGQLATSISTLVVQILREHTGRGPTKSRTHLSDDLISVVVQETLTRAERTLVDAGQRQLVLQARHALQDVMRAELVAGIEGLTGRTVIAFFGDNSIDPDIAVESFLLAHPRGATAKAD